MLNIEQLSCCKAIVEQESTLVWRTAQKLFKTLHAINFSSRCQHDVPVPTPQLSIHYSLLLCVCFFNI